MSKSVSVSASLYATIRAVTARRGGGDASERARSLP